MKFIKGEDHLFYIKKNTTWTPVACLKSNPISEETETIDTTTRENEGWSTSFPTNQSYSIEISGMVVKDDTDSGNSVISYRELRALKRQKIIFEWKIETLAGWYIDSGKAFITSISNTDDAGDFMNFSASLKGYGKPNESSAKVYVLADNDGSLLSDDDFNVIKTE